MKVKYIGENGQTSLFKGEVYDCLGREYNRYRIIDKEDTENLYPIELFEEIN